MNKMVSTLALLTTTFTGTFAFAADGTYDPRNPIESNAAIVEAVTAAVTAINSVDAHDAAGTKLDITVTLPNKILEKNSKPGAYKKDFTVVTLNADFKNGLSTSESTTEVISIDAGWEAKLDNLQNIVYLGLVGTFTPINEWIGTEEIDGATGGLAVVYNQVVSDINNNKALLMGMNIGADSNFDNYDVTLTRISANIEEFNGAWDEVVAAVNSVTQVDGITVVGLDSTDGWTDATQ